MTTDSETFEYKPDLDGTALRIGIVVGRFNQDIGDGLLSACKAELAKLGVANGEIEVVTVPGALEIPLALQKRAGTRRFDALVALGAARSFMRVTPRSRRTCAPIPYVRRSTFCTVASSAMFNRSSNSAPVSVRWSNTTTPLCEAAITRNASCRFHEWLRLPASSKSATDSG